MTTITPRLKQLLLLSNPDKNPFHMDFNFDQLRALEHWDDTEKVILEITLTLHSVFLQGFKDSQELVSSCKFSTQEILEELLIMSNRHLLLLGQQLHSASNYSKGVLDFERMRETEVKNGMGQMENAQDSSEILIDLYSLLFSYQESFGWLNVDEKNQKADGGYSAEEIVQRLILYINIVFNARIAYYAIVYDEVPITLDDTGNLILGEELDGLSRITAANEIRLVGRVNELVFPFMNARNKITKRNKIIDTIDVKGSEFSIILKDQKIDILDFAYFNAQAEVYYPYLLELRLKGFNDVTIIDMLKLISKLSAIIHHFQHYYQDKDLIKINPPFKIKCDELYDYLTNTADLGRDTVILFVKSLIQEKNNDIDLYRFPLMMEADYFLFIFPALNAPLPHPFVSRWLEASGIDNVQRRILFKRYIKDDLEFECKKNKLKQKWNVIELQGNEEFLGIETRDTFILIDFFCPEYTVNQKEERLLLKDFEHELSQRDSQGSDFLKRANINNKKPLKICITSNLHYSGIKIGGVPILDLILFRNYLLVGRYQRVKVLRDEKRGAIKDIYDIPYYSNPDQFEIGLPHFMNTPVPIKVLTSKMKQKQIPLFPPKFSYVIFQTISVMISEEDEEQLDLSNLDMLLKSQYFLDDSNANADKEINGLISKIFAKVADSQREDLGIVDQLIHSIKTSKRISSAHLTVYIRYMLGRAKRLTLEEAKHLPQIKYNVKDMKVLVESCFPKTKSVKIQLSNFELNAELTQQEIFQLEAFLLDNLGNLIYKDFNDDERVDIYMQIILLSGLVKEDREIHYLFIIIGNFIENLNLNHHFQTAREIALETWVYASKKSKHIYGLNILFKCYIKQKNILLSGVYGSILMASVDSLTRIEKSLYIDILFNLLRYFREFKYYELVKDIWKFANTLKLSTYDDQKFTVSYFNTRMAMNGLDDKDLVNAILKYLKKNFKEITAFGDLSIGPWMGLCMNIQRLFSLSGRPPHGLLNGYLDNLEASLHDKGIAENLRFQIQGNANNPKENFKRALIKALSDDNFEDFKYDVGMLRPLADNAFLTALDTTDYELMLLTSIVYNDQTLSFIDFEPKGKIKLFNQANKPTAEISDFLEKIKKGLGLTKRQIFIWLVELNGNIYRCVLNANDQIDVKQLSDWNPRKMTEWVRNVLPKFYFNSQKDRYYDFAAQETFSSKLVESLSSFDLLIEQPLPEILILKSVDMSSYPDNLLLNNGQLLSSNAPICNILNIEHYMANKNDISIDLNRINAWFPVDGGDGTINFGHSEMLPILNKYGAKIIETQNMERMPDGDINIFLAHGTTDLDGFKYFQADDQSYHYLTNTFGNGIIAILFICSSGNLHEDFQSNDIRSIGQDLLKQGYEAVIAPFWKYDVTMARLWLNEFFKVFNEGYSLMETVHLANRHVTSYDEQTQRMFVEPAGWAAMHLYGNPNIYFQIKNK